MTETAETAPRLLVTIGDGEGRADTFTVKRAGVLSIAWDGTAFGPSIAFRAVGENWSPVAPFPCHKETPAPAAPPAWAGAAPLAEVLFAMARSLSESVDRLYDRDMHRDGGHEAFGAMLSFVGILASALTAGADVIDPESAT